MPVPKFKAPKHKPSEIRLKSDYIVRTLISMNYNIKDEKDAIVVIESNGIDKFNFDYPYGSFDAYKEHVLAGEFDIDLSKMMTKAEHDTMERDIKEGKLWVTY